MVAGGLPIEQPSSQRAGRPVPDDYAALLTRLSERSVTHHFDAYADVPWDAAGYQIDATDARWAAVVGNPAGDGLDQTGWFRRLTPEQQARLGLDLVASKMKIGLEFESILKRGLLEFATTLPNGSAEFRYAYHELIEEAQHSLMFQEFVNRSGFDARGLGRWEQVGARFVARLGRRFPSLFFVFVLGGEDPIDHAQRQELRRDRELHPLLERIMRIHIAEEARHLTFARHYLRREVPRLGRLRRAVLGVGAPLILGTMAQMMLRPSSQIVRRHRIPRATLRQVYRHPSQRAEVLTSLRKVRELCAELGLVTPLTRQIWRAVGLWEAPRATGGPRLPGPG